jgi:hypothetical protein
LHWHSKKAEEQIGVDDGGGEEDTGGDESLADDTVPGQGQRGTCDIAAEAWQALLQEGAALNDTNAGLLRAMY